MYILQKKKKKKNQTHKNRTHKQEQRTKFSNSLGFTGAPYLIETQLVQDKMY